MRKIWIGFATLFAFHAAIGQKLPVPTRRQLLWQQMETTAFLHFTVNTFTDKEWGDGTEKESVFNPRKFDADQWISALKEAGFKMAILTAKHHDGFCLWPSAYTSHSVKNSPWENGKGDVVKQVADACRKYGLKFGIYLSPWDRHEPTYGTPAYNTYYKNQLRELLTHYGRISEVWFDGAKGPNAKSMEYDFRGYWQMVRQLQPDAVIFSDAGPDVRWVGNEKGQAGLTCWSTIDTAGLAPGKADPQYLNSGDPGGQQWVPAESDVSIRPGWFYHASQDNQIKTPRELVNLYYESVGRNSLLLLNVPPDTDGLLTQKDIESLLGFRKILDQTFHMNLAQSAAPESLTDGKLTTYVSIKQGSSLVISFGKPVNFDRVMLQENITRGQRVKSGHLDYWDGTRWKEFAEFTTIGYKRLLRVSPVNTRRVRLTIDGAFGPAEIASLGLYKASVLE